jgi:hypothetical protein
MRRPSLSSPLSKQPPLKRGVIQSDGCSAGHVGPRQPNQGCVCHAGICAASGLARNRHGGAALDLVASSGADDTILRHTLAHGRCVAWLGALWWQPRSGPASWRPGLAARGMLCGRRAQSSACPFRPGCHGCGHCEATILPALCTRLRAQAAAARRRRRRAASPGALAGLPVRSLLLGPGSAFLPPDQLPPASHGRHIRSPGSGGGLSRRQTV